MKKKKRLRVRLAPMGGRGKAARSEILTVLLWLPFALATLGIALYLGTCALPMGLEYLRGNGTGNGRGDESPITDLDLTDKVPAPVAGRTSAISFTAPQYVGKVAWINLDENAPYEGAVLFEADTRYEAVVEITPAPGYAFGGVEVQPAASWRAAEAPVSRAANSSFGHRDGEVEPGAETAAVNIIFPRTGSLPAAVSDLDLTGKIPAPARGATAKTYFAAPQYTGSVAWSPADAVFRAGQSYTATATLAAEPGWTFDGAGAFRHSRAASVSPSAAGVVVLGFPETKEGDSGSAEIELGW